MRLWIMATLMVVALAPAAAAVDGMIAIKSGLTVSETIDRLERIATEKNLTVFLRVDHAAGATKVGKELRPTELLVFGNPQGGTPLMQCGQSAGIDLPLKALAWEDEAGQVWLGYNDPAYLAKRHALGSACDAAIEGIGKAMTALAQAAVQP
jgi:uncharacterized protein (DUF302 family)